MAPEEFKVDMGSHGSFTKISHNKPYDTISPLRPELSSKGKNVIVTGGGTGIGKAIAMAFAQSGAASVSIFGRREDRLISTSKEITGAVTGNTRVLYRVTDLVDSSSTQASFKSIAAEVGKLDILVSNAGVLGEIGHVTSVNVENVMKAYNLNVRSAFNAVQAFVPLAGNDPVIISTSTAAIHIAPIPMAVAYTASKMAVYKTFEYLAAENPELHIVQIQPGVVATEINQGMPDVDRDRPELPGGFCVWLASPEARFLKNKFVWSNWDVDELKSRAEEIQNSNLLTMALQLGPPQSQVN
ncbi:uncharacterized protein A1O9_09005 [Exophiala aquamarina CBS 119918]|uniref:Oxidoreductase n=1 Tax=Exophiala aquamarina CBS 119918 TaxID=1182545 RepID=A0A072P5K0_9EURO|nr:uncharacterized protein A1O9_09005 [Exophiala aquamarina CBS 119918]KEF54563.1 hypothetical protein A1O9_09005 [Exophiala aquamarina CBS 119918]